MTIDKQSIATAIVLAWQRQDYEQCRLLMEKAIEVHRLAADGESPLASVALTIHTLGIYPVDLTDAGRQCLDLQAEILRLAVPLNSAFALPALKLLVDRKRMGDAAAIVPIAKLNPQFAAVATFGCIALYTNGDREGALALLRDRLKSPDCQLAYVKELVKIVRLTDRGEGELSALEKAIHGGAALAPWETVYFCELGIATSRQVRVKAGLDALTSTHGHSPAEYLSRAALQIDAFDFDGAYSFLQTPLGENAIAPWHAALQERLVQLVTVHMLSRQLREARAKAKPGRPKAALTLSGFVRSYEGMQSLMRFLLRHAECWDIDIFAQSFDRLGNLYMQTEELSSLFYDYSHGGFYREILKSPPLRAETLYHLLSPVAMQLEPRHPDEHYLRYLGLAHPQWLAVWEAWCLFECHQKKTGESYRLAIRGRYDRDYDSLDLDRIDCRDDQIVTPSNEFYGTPEFSICDMVAVGSPAAMKIYCSIGDGGNFKSVEQTETWQAKLKGREGSHEAHLSLWLQNHKIGIVRPEWFRLHNVIV